MKETSEIRMNQDLNSVCRTCAGYSTNLLPIFGHDGMEKKLGAKINQNLPISVYENDLLPTKICSRCIFSLEASIEFKNICQKADETLKNMLAEQQPPDVLTEFPTLPDVEMADTTVSNNQWIKQENVPICNTAGLSFTDNNTFTIHTQQLETPKTELILPDIAPVETVFYNEVEITKKKRTRPIMPKIMPIPIANLMAPSMTIITTGGPNMTKQQLLPVIKLSTSQRQKSAMEQLMTDKIPVKNVRQILQRRQLNIPSSLIDRSELGNKSLLFDYEEEGMNVEVFIPDATLGSTDDPMETVPICVDVREHPFLCENCGKGFRNKALLKDHIIRKYIATNPEEFEFPCEECGKTFPTGYSLKAHLRNKRAQTVRVQCEICSQEVLKKNWPTHFARHNQDERFKCLICNQTFASNAQLKQHSSVHSSSKFPCEFCGTTFNRKSNLTLHRKIHTEPEALAHQVKCDICNYQSNDRYYMMHHHKVHFSTTLYAYTCPVLTCNFTSQNFDQLRLHCAQSHCREELSLYTKRKKRTQRVSKVLIAPYLCKLCSSVFNRPVEYSSHISQEHGVQLMAGHAIFTCNHCKDCYGSLVDLNEHLECHIEAHKYPCSKCTETFAVFNNRNQHLASVHSTKFECEICNMSFMTVFKLKEHMPSHSDIKPFTCKICGKGFKRKRTLGEHQKVHSDVKKFECEHCHAKFRWKGDLVRHATRHTGINLYHCSECEFSSNKRKEVEAHISENHSVIVDMQV
ncbi:Hypothetical predicted protein [Cloeon dipterum]|uniref:Protein krueppel n=1 Tax=Cloeon dipterum TaxID=197152 RepID=A0A8S1CML3_9INSE|nr:Hypothetical predicted protein [Cloeon dipterum]